MFCLVIIYIEKEKEITKKAVLPVSNYIKVICESINFYYKGIRFTKRFFNHDILIFFVRRTDETIHAIEI